MKKVNYFLGVVILATVFLTSCKTDEPSNTDVGVVINGIKWATCNVAAPNTFASSPESTGMYYQWNRKIGWSASDPLINSNGVTKWDATVPGGTEWTTTNDPCPAGWCVPSLKIFHTLFDTDKVAHEWATQNGVNGRKFTDKVIGNSFFLPAVGRRGEDGNGELESVNYDGDYWSSTQYDEEHAFFLCFGFSDASVDKYYRNIGRPVRCVAE